MKRFNQRAPESPAVDPLGLTLQEAPIFGGYLVSKRKNVWSPSNVWWCLVAKHLSFVQALRYENEKARTATAVDAGNFRGAPRVPTHNMGIRLLHSLQTENVGEKTSIVSFVSRVIYAASQTSSCVSILACVQPTQANRCRRKRLWSTELFYLNPELAIFCSSVAEDNWQLDQDISRQ